MSDPRETFRGKQVVIQPRGETWAFVPPAGHRVDVSGEGEREWLALSTGQDSSMFRVVGIDEEEEEVRIRIGGAEIMGNTGSGEVLPPIRGYPLPDLGTELQRLASRFEELNGNGQQAQAWAAGSDYDEHTRELRHRIRELERQRPAAPS